MENHQNNQSCSFVSIQRHYLTNIICVSSGREINTLNCSLRSFVHCVSANAYKLYKILTLVWQYNVYSMYYWNVHYLYPIATPKLKSGQLLLMLLSFSILCCLNLSDNEILIHNCLFTTRLLLHIYRKSIFSHNQSEICFVLQRTQCSLHVPFVYSCTRVHY